jgi:hypothetical protein
MHTFEWAIEDVITGHRNLYLEHCVLMAVALMSQHSESPCEFLVKCDGFDLPDLDGDSEFRLRVGWNETTGIAAARIAETEQPKPLVERAAVALTALLLTHLVPNGNMRVAPQGDRTDYYLPVRKLAVEISGTIRRGEISRRRRAKVKQMLETPRG